jgi:hypothetical protein
MKFFVVLTTFILASCSDSNFKRVETLSEFRVLAIQADKPEANPGDTVNLRLFISDSGQGAGRLIEGVVSFCRDPGVAYGADVDCSFDPDVIDDTFIVDTSTPDFVNNQFSAFSDPLPVTVPANFLDQKSYLEKTNGLSFLAIFKFDLDGKNLKIFKRIIVTERTSLNSNPTGGEVLVNESDFAGAVSKGDNLEYQANSPETYSFINVDGTTELKEEEYSVAWYLSGGEVDLSKTNSREKTEITKLTEDPLVIVAVLRDDRGGVEVQRLTVP